MNKKILAILILIVAFVVGLSACSCSHEFVSANCTEPATCTKCSETEGVALGHDWSEATCTDPAVCLVCNTVEGEALGHEWTEATCEEAPICITCGEIAGEPLGHNVTQWETTKDPSCAEKGIQVGQCEICQKSISSDIEPLEHTPGEWVIETEATSTTEGKKVQYCTVCNGVVAEETYELTEEEKAELFKEECVKYSYNEIARNPDDYLLKPVKFTGEVIQVMEDGDEYTLRVNVTKGRYYWSDTILVQYTKRDSSEPRILEDDIITLYGYCMSTVTYETVTGASVTIPAVLATYIEID